MSRPLEFWFEFGSTYSYPAAHRVESRARDRGVDVVWRPFLLGPIFAAQGWNDSPFNLYPAKGRYMWRDWGRICSAAGLRWVRPSVFPRNGLLAARVAMKPLATLNRPVLRTVDTTTKEETVSFKERTDVTAVPAAGVVAETMTALVLAGEVTRKFGGDSLAELVRNHVAYVASLR